MSHNKILVVDDDPDIVQVVKFILENLGFEVCTYNSGLDVSEVVYNHLPNLILLDIGLPGKSGTQVCREIKKDHSIPIVFFSAHAEEGKAYSECLADGFVQKPFDIKDLVNTIESKLN